MFYIRFKQIFIEKWANRSFSLISSFLVSDVSDSVTIAHFLWAMWANTSGRSPKMSNHEGFAHIPQRKWAIMSESLRSLTKNEQMSESFIFGQKTSYSLGKPMSEFPALFNSMFEPIKSTVYCSRSRSRLESLTSAPAWIFCIKIHFL